MAPSIGLKVTNFFVLLLGLILTYQEVVEGRKSMESMNEEDLERQLRDLNKPPTKTIHAPWGDTYDCIEFHKQPAFDHPLLKNHKSKTRQEIVTKKSDKLLTSQVDGCPKGTVPIRRTTKEDLIRAQSLSLSSNAAGVQCRAGGYYNAESIYGARGAYNVWSPTVKQDQFSSAELTLQSGSEDHWSTVIKQGWTVDPQLYGDNKARGFAYWTADGGHKTGCYNSLCRGFVQVHDKYTPDLPFAGISIVNGTQGEFLAETILEESEGKWWMKTEGNIEIGYWPQELFPAFKSGAKHIYWGGRVKSGNDGVAPPMGSGQEIDEHSAAATGYVRNLNYINNDYEIRQPESIEDVNDCKNLYAAEYLQGANILEFGGHGGATAQ